MYYYYRILHFVLMNLKCIRERKRAKGLYMDKNEGVVGCGGGVIGRGGGGEQ